MVWKGICLRDHCNCWAGGFCDGLVWQRRPPEPGGFLHTGSFMDSFYLEGRGRGNGAQYRCSQKVDVPQLCLNPVGNKFKGLEMADCVFICTKAHGCLPHRILVRLDR